MATALQQPCHSSGPKVAFVEKFDCTEITFYFLTCHFLDFLAHPEVAYYLLDQVGCLQLWVFWCTMLKRIMSAPKQPWLEETESSSCAVIGSYSMSDTSAECPTVFWVIVYLLLLDCIHNNCSGKGKHYTTNVWSRGKQSCFPQVLMFPRTKSREISGLKGKQN